MFSTTCMFEFCAKIKRKNDIFSIVAYYTASFPNYLYIINEYSGFKFEFFLFFL